LESAQLRLSIRGFAERRVHVKRKKAGRNARPRSAKSPASNQREGETPMQSTIVTKATTTTHTGIAARVLNIALWVLQVLLAAAFLAHGWLMVAPPAELVALINAQLGVGLRLFIGVAEVLAAVGLIL